MRRNRKAMWLAIKTAAALLILIAVGRHFARILSSGELWTSLNELRYEFLLPAGLLYLGAHTVWGTFWVQLMRGQGASIRWIIGIRAYFISQLGKYVPGKVMVLLLRVILLRGDRLSPAMVAVTGTYETLTSMAAGALLAICLLPWTGPSVGLEFGEKRMFALLGLAGLPIAAGVIHRMAAKSRISPSPWLLIRGLLQDALGWLMLGLSLWLTVLAVSPSAPPMTGSVYLQDLGAVALSYVAGFVVLVPPGGLGARELVLQQVLTPQLGESSGGQAVVIALVLRLVWTAFELLAAAGLFWLVGPNTTEPEVAETDSLVLTGEMRSE